MVCVFFSALPEWDKKIQNAFLSLYDSLFWECKAKGKPSPSYSWLKNGQPLMSEVRFLSCCFLACLFFFFFLHDLVMTFILHCINFFQKLNYRLTCKNKYNSTNSLQHKASVLGVPLIENVWYCQFIYIDQFLPMFYLTEHVIATRYASKYGWA